MGFLDKLLGNDDGSGGEGDAQKAARESRVEQDLARLAAGSIPIAAEQRLQELAAGQTGFTSNLSVADFALTQLEGVRPIAQVQGSSIYKVGWQNYPWGGFFRSQNADIQELTPITAAWNEARRLALSRLAAEAKIAGCHAVVDVTFSNKRHDFLQDDIEIIVTGTAVHLPEGGRDGDPVLTDLSMPDFVLLRRAGYVPVGIVTSTSVFYIIPSRATVRATSGWQRNQPNQELPDYTQGIYTARETALARITSQAQSQGAQGMVGVQLVHTVHVREVEQNNRTREDLIVTFHVLGTGIYQHGDHRPLAPNNMIRLNRKQRTL